MEWSFSYNSFVNFQGYFWDGPEPFYEKNMSDELAGPT